MIMSTTAVIAKMDTAMPIASQSVSPAFSNSWELSVGVDLGGGDDGEAPGRTDVRLSTV